MDFRLLNFWIHKLHLNIEYPHQLYLKLKSHKKDFLHSHVILLSQDKNKILEFLGFDTSIQYDLLSEKNMFEYLCTSKWLNPQYIKYCGGMKGGPYAINKTHSRFDQYLKNKEYKRSSDSDRDIVNVALQFFDKHEEYTKYKNLRSIIEKVEKKETLVKCNHDDFIKFTLLYGVLQISTMNDEEFVRKWTEFIKFNWSGLRVMC